jgi:site-specific DNA-methyltransferase (adenine-specific)
LTGVQTLLPGLAPAPAVSLVDDQQRGHRAAEFCQWMTPEWVAELLMERVNPQPGDRVVDPGCGRGAFLKAVPAEVEAIGIEIDPAMAAEAEANSGRPVVIGDFRTVPLPFQPSLVVGNPPFEKKLVDALLERVHGLLPDGGRCALLLPAYHLQWSRPVVNWARMFSIESIGVPREIFPGLTCPLQWVVFTREKVRRMTGLFLYPEMAAVKGFTREAKLILIHGRPRTGAWRALVDAALDALGGQASLAQIYGFAEGRRPTTNPEWHAQIRKVVQHPRFYVRVAEALYRKAA